MKIGVVGAGIYGSYHIQAYLSHPKVSEVVFCDIDSKLREKVAAEYNIRGYTSVSDMLDNAKPDITAIATPDPYHFEPSKEIISRGIPILIEKPLTLDLSEAEELVRLAEKHKTRVSIDFHKRWDPAYLAIRKELESDTNDKIIRGSMSLDDTKDVPLNWLSWSEKSSPVWFLGVHCYDLIRFFSQSEVKSVYAVGSKGFLKSQGKDCYDNIQALLSMDDGSFWNVENSWVLPNSFPKANDGKLLIISQKKYFRNESYRGLDYYTENSSKSPNYIFMNRDGNKVSGFGFQPMIDFIDDIYMDRPFSCDIYDGLAATKIAHAVHQSVETGKAVNVFNRLKRD